MAISRRMRRALLLTAVLVFCIAAYIAIQYAQGYQFSFAERRFVRTGAITIDANDRADVLVQGEPAGDTSFLGNTFNMGALLPGTYPIRLEREGWSSWFKEIEVQEGLVTDFPHVLLLPLDEASASRSVGEIESALAVTSPSPSPAPASPYTLIKGALSRDGQQVATGVLGYKESGDGAKLLWWTRNELWVLWLADTGYQPFRKAGEQETLTRLSSRIDRAAWWPDADHVVIKSGEKYYVVELDTRGGTNTIVLE